MLLSEIEAAFKSLGLGVDGSWRNPNPKWSIYRLGDPTPALNAIIRVDTLAEVEVFLAGIEFGRKMEKR